MNNVKETLAQVKGLCKSGEYEHALKLLRASATPSDPLPLQAQYAHIAKLICVNLTNLPVVRVAFIGGSTLDHLIDSLRFWMLLEGFKLESYLAPFDTWRQEAGNPDSGLYSFKPDIVWLFITARDIKFETLFSGDLAQSETLVIAKAEEISAVARQIISTLPALILVNNAEAHATRTFGNFEATVSWALAALVRRYNLQIAQTLPPGAKVFDIDHLASRFGLDRWEDARLWFHSKHPFSLEAHSPVAFAGAKLISAAKGKARKCLILDLDNTLWGGVVGDDGVNGIRIGSDSGAVGEAFAAFQVYLKTLSQRGIALAVCSKNNSELAQEPFRSRSGMVLNIDDFAVFKANWENKADNIRSIAKEMNLGLDAFVFIDDNPAERELIRAEIPEVAVPNMSLDPANYVRDLASGAWFETLAFVEEDRNRSKAYRDNALRNASLEQVSDIESYLKSLNMSSSWGVADNNSLTRLAQLINKTNQFHLTTTRYSEAELSKLLSANNIWIGWFSLSDRFGDHGIIAAIILKFINNTAIVDTWTMSCRVFSRGMEDFIFQKIWDMANERGCLTLEGVYRPTQKNGVVALLYDRLGGNLIYASENECRWQFNLTVDVTRLTHFITDKR